MPRNRKAILIGVIIVSALLLLIDRYYWAQIAQWREDQATNLWLGYTARIGNIPVGLMSSQRIPNPNGMILLGIIFSKLPNLLSVSIVLGVTQVILIALVGWQAFKEKREYVLVAIIPVLSSVILRSTSVEFWNQYTSTLVNLFFLFWALKYLENRSLWNILPITILIVLAPSLYLAGIVNAIVMTILTVGMLIYQRPKWVNVFPVLMVTIAVILLSIFITWLPYLHAVDLEQLTNYNNKTRLSPVDMLDSLLESFFGLPFYGALQWSDQSIYTQAFNDANPKILSSSTLYLLRMIGAVYLLQTLFAFAVLLRGIVVHLLKRKTKEGSALNINSPTARLVTLAGLFICLSYAFSSWLGGPPWIIGARPDQTVQFLPMFLLLIFLLPLTFTLRSGMEQSILKISYGTVVIFGAINMLCGWMILHDHLHYRGTVITEADVPLAQKMQVIKFIADDWKRTSDSDIIPVDYDLGGGIWDWVPTFGNALTKWYPAPMTDGREFDYEFLHQYGLVNYQEGKQFRTFGTGRYLITYTLETPPQNENKTITHYIFGRLRVSIVDR